MMSAYDNRVWQHRYPPGTPPEIDIGGTASIVRLLKDAVAAWGDRPAFNSYGGVLSYRDVDRLSRDFAAYLQGALGLARGDRVAMMAPNALGFVIGMFGILRAGGVQVNVNPLYTPRELGLQLKDADVRTIVIFNGSTPTLAEAIGETPLTQVISFGLDDLVGRGLPSPPVDSRIDPVTLTDALSAGATLDFDAPEVGPGDLAFLQYTGGTTGQAKGAMLTHGNIVSNALQLEAMDPGIVVDGEEVVLTSLPMYHIYALTVNTIHYLKRGASNVLIADPRDMETLVRTWAAVRPTITTGVNTLYRAMLLTPGFDALDFSGFKIASGGGASIHQAVSQEWHAVAGKYIKEGYGLSETSPVVTSNPLTEDDYRPGIGIPVPGTDVSLRDDSGREVPVGEPGELCVRGPQVMAGYWRNPDATKEAMTDDGYFRTGDIAIMESDGQFRIMDRKKDMVLVSGFNVFPNEVESVIAGMPGIVECACIGVDDEVTGEAVKVFVARSDDSITEDDVVAWCRKQLSPYKVPKQVRFMRELPKSAVGKILRRELR